MDLSIVIPAYNEQKKIEKDIHEAADFLHRHNLTGEIIVVDDGSDDDTVGRSKKTGENLNTPVQVLEYIHKGKGHAVKTGILQAQSDIVMFIDSGGCVPYDTIMVGICLLGSDECDIAHGSRLLAGSTTKGKSKSRKVFSWGFKYHQFNPYTNLYY